MGSIKHFNLQELIQQNDIKYFVETGTYYGDGVEYATKFSFEHIYSFEIMDEIYQSAKKRFSNNKDVTLLLGNSADLLKNVLPQLDGNSLFFLDAHFPGADAGLKDYDSEKNADINIPLHKELQLVSERIGKFKDVIIIDDMRLFESNSKIRFHDVDSHFKNIGKNVSRKTLLNFDIYDVFKQYYKDCKIEFDYSDEGYYVIKT